MRPCTCDRFSKHYQPGECRLCWLHHYDLRYHLQWGGTQESWSALQASLIGKEIAERKNIINRQAITPINKAALQPKQCSCNKK